MDYIIGDIHGDQKIWTEKMASFLTAEDTVIVLGDFGIGFYGDSPAKEDEFYDYLEEQKYTILFVDGNHENHEKLKQYPISEYSLFHIVLLYGSLFMRGGLRS